MLENNILLTGMAQVAFIRDVFHATDIVRT